jgi:hypothetical protein
MPIGDQSSEECVRGPKRAEITSGWRRLHSSYSSSNMISDQIKGDDVRACTMRRRDEKGVQNFSQ